MNKMKRFLAASFAMVMIAGSAMVANAEGSSYRLPMCPNCQQGGLHEVKTYYTSWKTTGKKRTCTERPHGEDLEVMRKKLTDQKCNHCQRTVTIEKKEYKWECHGYY